MRLATALAHPFVFGLLVFGLLFEPGTAQAQERLGIELSPLSEVSPFHHRWTLRSTENQQVVRDRRLLRFTVRPEGSRRRHRCVHPNAPRRVLDGRVTTLHGSETHEEWIDLRMYCWGRALDALRAGPATIEVTYGFARRGRHQWVAKREGERRPTHRVSGTTLAWTPPVAPEASEDAVRVTVAPATTRSSWPAFRGRVRGRGRVYMKDDLWSFVVTGPLGTVQCQPRRQPVVPIIDFYRRLGRRGTRASLSSRLYCPESTFEIEGVYDVQPILELVYDGSRHRLEDVVTGTFEGESSPIRVLRRGPYVEHDVATLLAHFAPPGVGV